MKKNFCQCPNKPALTVMYEKEVLDVYGAYIWKRIPVCLVCNKPREINEKQQVHKSRPRVHGKP